MVLNVYGHSRNKSEVQEKKLPCFGGHRGRRIVDLSSI